VSFCAKRLPAPGPLLMALRLYWPRTKRWKAIGPGRPSIGQSEQTHRTNEGSPLDELINSSAYVPFMTTKLLRDHQASEGERCLPKIR
jgi:hypothetical protein